MSHMIFCFVPVLAELHRNWIHVKMKLLHGCQHDLLPNIIFFLAVYEEQLEAEENEAEDNNAVEHQKDSVTIVVTPPSSPSDSFSTPDIDPKTREALAKLLENKRNLKRKRLMKL